MTSSTRFVLILGAGLLAGPAAAQDPSHLQNARLQTRSAAAGLEAAFRAALSVTPGPAWIGYAVPTERRHQMCCWDSVDDAKGCCGGCRLEGDRGSFTSGERDGGVVRLEGPFTMRVLFRVEHGQVGKVKTFSGDCALDAGGLPFVWLEGVRPAESLKLLASFAGDADAMREERRKADGALSAIAFHADPAADGVLESFTAPGKSEHVRKQAAFWMGNTRGRRGYETLRRLVRDDTSERFREHVVFALSQSEVPEAVDAMIGVAKRDPSSHVRGQALFWLGQKAGRKATAAISDAIEADPETEIKKKAVFALSQLPRDEGVPLLIQQARANRNAAVRKQAIFWLGQSKDPRALAFFEEVLKD